MQSDFCIINPFFDFSKAIIGNSKVSDMTTEKIIEEIKKTEKENESLESYTDFCEKHGYESYLSSLSEEERIEEIKYQKDLHYMNEMDKKHDELIRAGYGHDAEYEFKGEIEW